MKWGRKKPPSSCTKPSLISHVFPTSWLAKFKHIGINPGGQSQAKVVKQKEKWNSVYVRSHSPRCDSDGDDGCGGGGGRFYGGEGDDFWRLSFGDQNSAADGKKNIKTVFGPVSCDFNHEQECGFPPPSCQSCRSNGKEDAIKLSEMVSDVRKLRGLSRTEGEILPEMETSIREKLVEIRTPRLRVEREKKLRRRNKRVVEEKQLESDGEPYEEERIPKKSGRTNRVIEREDCKLTGYDSRGDCYLSSMNSRECLLRESADDYMFSAQKENDGLSAKNLSLSKWQKLKEMQVEELKPISDHKQRKSLYISRDQQKQRPSQNIKVRAFSPRTASKAEICRIKALEDMKKAKLKKKNKARDKRMEGFSGLESFALVKCSFDPQKDFRDSMIEMIQEKQISKPEELEELLACYLTLNSDKYHDLIIKVFRHVWFDLNQACFDTEVDDENC